MYHIFNRQKRRFSFYMFFVCLSCLCDIGLALVMSKCIDLALAQQLDQFLLYGIAFLLFILIYMSVDYIAKKTRFNVLQYAQITLRDETLSQIMTLSIDAFRNRNSGDWVSLLSNDVETIGQSYFSVILRFIPQVISFLGCFSCLCILSWPLALFVITFTLIQMVIPKVLAPQISAAKEEQSNKASEFTVEASEHLQGFSLLKSLNLIGYSLAALSRTNALWEKTKFKVKHFTLIANTLSYGFGTIVYIGLYFLGAILVATNRMTLGTMVAITQLSVYIMGPLQTFSGDVAEIISSRKLMKKLYQFSDSHEDARTYIEKIIPSEKTDNLCLSDVSFGYDENQLFSDISFRFERGKKYILSGPSGTGKTTIANLLNGSIAPNQGVVYFGPFRMEQLDPGFIVKSITICSQNTFIFNDTLRNNVTLFNSNYTDEQVYEVLHRVGFDYVLKRLEHGLDEMLGQSGQNLSGGERQRIALARVELLDTPYIIFDESFANLDLHSVRDILAPIVQDPEKTIIYIGHQLSEDIVSMFDVIVEIKNKQLSSAIINTDA